MKLDPPAFGHTVLEHSLVVIFCYLKHEIICYSSFVLYNHIVSVLSQRAHKKIKGKKYMLSPKAEFQVCHVWHIVCLKRCKKDLYKYVPRRYQVIRPWRWVNHRQKVYEVQFIVEEECIFSQLVEGFVFRLFNRFVIIFQRQAFLPVSASQTQVFNTYYT